MANEIQVWNKVMSAALAMPGVKVDRNQFLKSKLGRYCTEAQVETALSYSPLKVLSRQDIDRIANSVISSHIKQVTAISAAAGVPGGFAMAATIPGDIAQYYYHVFNLSQKLAYLYGYPNLLDEDGNATDDTINLLTLFTGVMMGAAVANNGIREVSKQLAAKAVKRLPRQALTKGVIYPLVKKIAAMLGYKLTKETFAKGVGKLIPVLGGVVSGGLTYATFRPGAKRLQKTLQGEMEYFYRSMGMDGTENFKQETTAGPDYTSYEEVNDMEEEKTLSIEEMRIVCLIDVAYIDNDMTSKERQYINKKIEDADLSDDEKFELIQFLKEGKVPPFKFDAFKNDNKEGIRLLKDVIEMLKLDNRFTLGEKLYVKKIGKEMGFALEELNEFMQ